MAGTGGCLGQNQDPPTHFLDPVLNWNFPDGIASVQIMLHIDNTTTDGGSTAMHSKAISGLDGLDWILLRKLVLLITRKQDIQKERDQFGVWSHVHVQCACIHVTPFYWTP